MLQPNDYKNLLSLYYGKTPAWTTDSLRRTVEVGLVLPPGNKLTYAGRRKGWRLSAGVYYLKKGMPINRRIANRTHELTKEHWYFAYIRKKRFFFNDHALFRGHNPHWIKPERMDLDATNNRQFRNSLHRLLDIKPKAWFKVQPYAVQIDQVAHFECICFASQTGHYKIRIQSKYFDLIQSLYEEPTFWTRPEPKYSLLLVRPACQTSTLLAAIKPVVNKKWKFPEMSVICNQE